MPVVPPMVSAATGALLVPHAPEGQVRTLLLLGCYAMFDLSLLASVIITALIWYRLTQHKLGPTATVPTLWIVLGWLGQSITAVNALGAQARLVLPAPYSTAFDALGLVYGVPILGFALFWMTLCLILTIRTARDNLPFSLTWWSFIFPVGTLVTGTSALAVRTELDALTLLATGMYVTLAATWTLVAVRTALACRRGELFEPT